MSVREEDKKKSSSSNTGLKMATAIGIGTAAAAVAVYYLFNRPERDEGETSHAQQHSLVQAERGRESNISQQNFRQRSWSLEECSICCEVMLNNQEITTLPCTHNFHTKCLLPWIEHKETCPNCRKNF